MDDEFRQRGVSASTGLEEVEPCLTAGERSEPAAIHRATVANRSDYDGISPRLVLQDRLN